ncbi:MAG: GAF domain-containing protein [Labilithrix sp.]|nr:GAF domain-containing protein [Labilithrix sp.]
MRRRHVRPRDRQPRRPDQGARLGPTRADGRRSLAPRPLPRRLRRGAARDRRRAHDEPSPLEPSERRLRRDRRAGLRSDARSRGGRGDARERVVVSDLSILPPRCFWGVAPAVIATSSRDGVPNVTYLSQVHYLGPRRVALSCQFFNKTRQNVAENPYVSIHMYDPVTLEAYEIDLRFLHAETSGPLFDEMAVRIQAIASHTGMKGIFKLLSADVYDVSSVEKVEGFLEPHLVTGPAFPAGGPERRGEIRALQVVSDRLNRARDLDQLLTSLLETLRVEMGFEHSMLLMPDESGAKLFAVASRGYGESGVGAEVEIGDGLIGTVAQQRKVLRLSDVEGAIRYGRTIRDEATKRGGPELAAEIPLPGLPDARSHLGIPLLVQDRLVGVLAVESKHPLGLDEWHEAFLNIVGNQAAIAIDRMLDDDEIPIHATTPPAPAPPALAQKKRTFRFYKGDDSVFVDGEYLIRNVAARILWRLLTSYLSDKRTDFTNRELRLDPWLGLPPIKDNLESRLILLRKRLEQKCPDVRIPSRSRGCFRFEADCAIELVEAS